MLGLWSGEDGHKVILPQTKPKEGVKVGILNDRHAQRVARVVLTVATVCLMLGIILGQDSSNDAAIWTILRITGIAIGALCMPFVCYQWLTRLRQWLIARYR